MVNPPCKNCQERKMLCHSSCEKYLEYKKKNDALKEKIYEAKRVENLAREAEHNRVQKIMRRRGSR